MTEVLTAPATEAVRVAPPPWRTVGSLALREGRLLLRHPATRVGIALAAVAWFAVWFESQEADVLFDPSNTFAFPLVLLAFGMVVAANLGALRSRRAGTDELFGSLPMPADRRTLAHLLSAVAGVTFAAVVFALVLGLWQARPSTIGTPPLQLVAVLLLLVAGGIVTGVLVARWAPHAIAGAGAVVALVVLQSNFGHENEHYQWLHFLPQQYSSVFDVGPVAWHIPYVAGLVVLGGALAVARHGLTRPVTVALVVAVAVVGAGAWAQTRPFESRAVALQADRIEHPAAHQTCEQHAGVSYCTYPSYAGWIDEWRAPVDGVRAQLPVEARARVTEVWQRTAWTVEVTPSVKARVDQATAWPADGLIHPGISWFYGGRHELGLGYQVAARALDLPTVTGIDRQLCSAGGQARGVVAFWLAGQATPGAGRELARRVRQIVKQGTVAASSLHVANAIDDWSSEFGDQGGDWIPELGSGARGADLQAAEALLAMDRARVGAVVRANWTALRDPATTGLDVFRLVGTAPPPGYAALPPVRPGVGQACA